MTLYYKTEDEKYLPVNAELVPAPTEKEFLLVRVGDPETGWIPEQREIEDILKLLDELLPKPRGPQFIYHYGINMEVMPIPETPTLLVLEVGDRAAGWVPEQTELDKVEEEFKKLLEAYPNVKIKAVHAFLKPLVSEKIEPESPAIA